MSGIDGVERVRKLMRETSSCLTKLLSEVCKVGESCFLRKEQANSTDFCCGVISSCNRGS